MALSDVQGKTALVTGASSGIGRALSRLLAADGCNLVLVAHDPGKLDAAAGELAGKGARVRTISSDLSVPAAASDLAAQLAGTRIDILVNDAGFGTYGPFAQADAGQEQQMLQVNVVTLTSLTRLLLPGMLERGWGRILNLGSIASFAPAPSAAVYAASKAYVLSFSRALAEEVRGSGVTVTTLCPGPTATNFGKRSAMEKAALFARTMDPSVVALAGYRALLAGRRVTIPGAFNRFVAIAPRFVSDRLVIRLSGRLMQ